MASIEVEGEPIGDLLWVDPCSSWFLKTSNGHKHICQIITPDAVKDRARRSVIKDRCAALEGIFAAPQPFTAPGVLLGLTYPFATTRASITTAPNEGVRSLLRSLQAAHAKDLFLCAVAKNGVVAAPSLCFYDVSVAPLLEANAAYANYFRDNGYIASSVLKSGKASIRGDVFAATSWCSKEFDPDLLDCWIVREILAESDKVKDVTVADLISSLVEQGYVAEDGLIIANAPLEKSTIEQPAVIDESSSIIATAIVAHSEPEAAIRGDETPEPLTQSEDVAEKLNPTVDLRDPSRTEPEPTRDAEVNSQSGNSVLSDSRPNSERYYDAEVESPRSGAILKSIHKRNTAVALAMLVVFSIIAIEITSVIWAKVGSLIPIPKETPKKEFQERIELAKREAGRR